MSDGAVPGVEVGDVLERHAAEPRRGHGQLPRSPPAVERFSASRAQVHLVLLAAFVVGRDLVAADEQPQRFGRVADLHAEVGRLRPIELHRQLRLADVQRRVDVDDAGHRLDARRPAAGRVRFELASGPVR